jgi:hypothetical protein
MPIHDWRRVRTGVFHDFHQDWTICLKRALNGGILPPGYYAMVEQASSGRYPDVVSFLIDRGAGDRRSPSLNGGVLTLAEAPPRVGVTAVIEADPYAQRANRIVVVNENETVVAVIEIVSPGNKSSRGDFQSFVEKAIQFLRLGIHLLIVDLFPPTSRDPQGLHAAIWSAMTDCDFQLPEGKPLTVASYSAGFLRRAFVETLAVGDLLPAMPLFLEAESYVEVPLETTYQTAFDDVPKPYRDELSPPTASS